MIGCGHAGDGNVHLSVFQPDAEIRTPLVLELLAGGMAMGGAISGEHGLGRAKAQFFLELGDPVVIALMQRVKQAFDPNGILGPGNLPGLPAAGVVEPVPVNGAQLIVSTLAVERGRRHVRQPRYLRDAFRRRSRHRARDAAECSGSSKGS